MRVAPDRCRSGWSRGGHRRSPAPGSASSGRSRPRRCAAAWSAARWRRRRLRPASGTSPDRSRGAGAGPVIVRRSGTQASISASRSRNAVGPGSEPRLERRVAAGHDAIGVSMRNEEALRPQPEQGCQPHGEATPWPDRGQTDRNDNLAILAARAQGRSTRPSCATSEPGRARAISSAMRSRSASL